MFVRNEAMIKDIEIKDIEMKIMILMPNNSAIFIPNVETEVNPRIRNGKVSAVFIIVMEEFSFLK